MYIAEAVTIALAAGAAAAVVPSLLKKLQSAIRER